MQQDHPRVVDLSFW